MAISLSADQIAQFKAIGVSHLVIKNDAGGTPRIVEWHNTREAASKVARQLIDYYVGQIETDGSITEFHQTDLNFDNYKEPARAFAGTITDH